MNTVLGYRGASISSAQLPAARAVPIDVSKPADVLVATVGGREVGRTTGPGSTRVVCDLRGLTGRTSLRVSRTVGRSTERVDKSFTAVPDRQPGPDNTGVPAGTVLTPHGPLTITTPGVVLEGLDITGPVRVLADDVTLRACRVRSAGTIVSGSGRRLLLEDVELDGMSQAGNGCMIPEFTLRRVHIHHVSDGARLRDRCLVEDSWIHDMARQGAQHPDCLQTTGGTGSIVRHNTLDVVNHGTGDLGNAAIQIGGEQSRLTDFTVVDNWLFGGNYTLNVGQGDIDHTALVIDGNRFLGGWRYGALIAQAAVNPVGNTLADGSPVKVARW